MNERSRTALTIRAFEPSDIPGLTDILNMPTVVAGTLQLPFRSYSARLRWLEHFHPTVNLVAEKDGLLVGQASLQAESEMRCRHSGSLDIAVHDAYRRQGVGRQLLNTLLDQADNWIGLRRLELTVLADNHAAITLYESLGFQREGLFREYALKAGAFVDAIPMARLHPTGS